MIPHYRGKTLSTCRSYWAASCSSTHSQPINEVGKSGAEAEARTKRLDGRTYFKHAVYVRWEMEMWREACSRRCYRQDKRRKDRSVYEAGAVQLSIGTRICIIPCRRMGPCVLHAAAGASSASKPESSHYSWLFTQRLVLVLY
jgi:hypothetical protein